MSKMILIDQDAIASFKWNTELAVKLRTMRNTANLSRTQLSNLSGVSVDYISQLERPTVYSGTPKKSTNPTITRAKLEALCLSMGKTLKDLFVCAEISQINT